MRLDAPLSEPFGGELDDTTFKIMRRISGQNSFIPVIRGRLKPSVSGTELRLVMHLHPVVVLFVGMWCGVLGNQAVTHFRSAYHELPGLFCLGMVLFAVILTVREFYHEAARAEKLLRDQLGAA